MPYRISRLGTVEIRSLDLDRDLDYYVNVLGLQLTAREGRTAYLKGWDERHAYSVVLTEADRAGMVRRAFRPSRRALQRDGLHRESAAHHQPRAVAGGPEGDRAAAPGSHPRDRA